MQLDDYGATDCAVGKGELLDFRLNIPVTVAFDTKNCVFLPLRVAFCHLFGLNVLLICKANFELHAVNYFTARS